MSAAALTGWLLTLIVGGLAAFGVRRRLPTVPLGRASAWLRVHAYGGFASAAVFVAHACYRPDAGFNLPDGPFEAGLALLYIATAGSGMLGLTLVRVVPARLTVRGEDLIFERLPLYRRELRERAEALVLRAAAEAEHTTLADFYTRRLAEFFGAPRHYWHHLVQSRAPLHGLVSELESIQRYLGDREQAIAADLAALVERKDDVDYAAAMQGTLKGWLVAHLAATIALLVFTAAHIAIVYEFGAA